MISLKRIIKTGLRNFSRNIGLSLAAIFIMVTVLALVTFLYFMSPISDILISDVEKKVDVSVYFKEDVLEEDIFLVEAEIGKIAQVKEAEYISKEQALQIFLDKHKDDPVLIESLSEVGYNPFLASLNIKANQASQYEEIAQFLQEDRFKDLIDKVDYYQRKPVIEKIYAFTGGIKNMGIGFSVVFSLIAVLIAFNTIRIAIHNSNDEISTMRLIGAPNWFVRGPFLVQGAFVGFVAAIITLLLTFGVAFAIDGKVKMLMPDLSIFGILLNNVFYLFLIQLLAGMALGLFSSLIAIRKYLRI